jgi:peptidoglycan/LPS O-acetylase OafA/YrhL
VSATFAVAASEQRSEIRPDHSPGDSKAGSKEKERFYRPELDVLRFFAFLGVFIFHAAPHTRDFYRTAGAPHWLSSFLISVFGAGAYGVDLFFALSAYLITSLLLRERDLRGTIDLRGFYLRRMLRIWPLYLSFVAFAALVGRFIPGQRLSADYLLGFTFMAGNWVYVFHGLPQSFAIPLWTVSIEEQFYLTWPLALRKANPRRIAHFAIALLVVSHLLRAAMVATGASINAMEYNTFTRLDPIALGILVALAADRLPSFLRWQRWALMIFGVTACIAAYAMSALENNATVSTWHLSAAHSLTAFGSLAIMLAVLGTTHPFFRSKALIYLGKISYGLYVIHEFAHLLARQIFPAASPLRVLMQSGISLALTVALAAASYRWLETPFLRLKERYAHVRSRPV